MADTNKLHSINTSRILRTIWLNPGISRIKVAELLDLDRSTVTKIMQGILSEGIVVTTGKNTEQSGVGRRQINLEINESIGVVLGIELQNARYSMVVTTITGQVLKRFSGTLLTDGTNLIRNLHELIETARSWTREQGLGMLGIGIGLPGIIDPYKGLVIRSNPFHSPEPVSVRDELQKLVSEYVFIENDANCCCWGELAFNRENRDRNFMVVLGEFRDLVTTGPGFHGLAIGLGLVVREKVLHGDHFTAGEYRSICATRETGQFHIPGSRLTALPEDTVLLREVYQELAENLALIVNCVDCTKIVFCGDLAAHRENLQELVAQAIEYNWIYDLERTFLIGFSEHGEHAVAMGAAGLFIEKLFSVPDVADRFHELVGYDLYCRILSRAQTR